MSDSLRALVTVRGISFDEGKSYPIQRDSDEWREWFLRAEEGAIIKFMWSTGDNYSKSFTAYRRRRYFEAQKRVSGKLRNKIIKPQEATYSKLEEIGYELTAYNWTNKSEGDIDRELLQPYQPDLSEAGEEVAKLRAKVARLEQRESYLLDQLGLVRSQLISEAQEENIRLKEMNTQLDNHNWELEKRNTTLDDLWQKSERKRTELESLVKEYQTATSAPSQISANAVLNLLDEFLGEQGLTATKNTRDWVQLNRFKEWLEGC